VLSHFLHPCLCRRNREGPEIRHHAHVRPVPRRDKPRCGNGGLVPRPLARFRSRKGPARRARDRGREHGTQGLHVRSVAQARQRLNQGRQVLAAQIPNKERMYPFLVHHGPVSAGRRIGLGRNMRVMTFSISHRLLNSKRRETVQHNAYIRLMYVPEAHDHLLINCTSCLFAHIFIRSLLSFVIQKISTTSK
jgi:hypothetical protein